MRLYALAGLQVDFPLSIKQEWQQFTNGRLTKEETTSPFSLVPVQFSPIAGLGVQLNVTRHLSVFCQPSVQWFVPASDPVGGSGLQTWRTEHELAFSIPFGTAGRPCWPYSGTWRGWPGKPAWAGSWPLSCG